VCILATLIAAPPSPAQVGGQPAQTVFSMGQPPRWQPYLSVFGMDGRGAGAGSGALLGIEHPIRNPIAGLFSVSAEGFAERRAGLTAGGARLLARMPALGLAAGADWRATSGDVDPILSFEMAGRRGGVLGHGSMLRVDWLPTRRNTVAVGVDIPLMQPFAGRTRPRGTTADLPPARVAESVDSPRVTLPDTVERALSALAQGATLIRAYTNLYSQRNERVLVGSSPANRLAMAGNGAASATAPQHRETYDAVSQAYRAALLSAFAMVAGDRNLGDRIADRARSGALIKVILPYDALFGQVKEGDGRLGPLLANARDDFARWLRDSSGVVAAARPRVLAVHDRWLGVLDAECGQLLSQWNDSRLVWLPPQLALAPDQYDDQAEVDALIARAVGHPFTDHNALTYLRTSDLPLEITRSILAARRYHVLWTHDFTGRRENGALDEIAYTMVSDAYLPALTAAVSRYDSTGTLPQFVILFDAFYYHVRDGALWMNILGDPLGATVRLQVNEDPQAAHLRQRLSELRSAVARSVRLQREAAAHGGDAWLREVVRVHVNVTQPSDFSFRSRRIVPPFPFGADNLMRDHRKLVLYDFTEDDPYTGAMLVTGIGIGEQYSSPTWYDLGYRMSGPAALEARAAVRRLLAANGFRADQIPVPLRVADSASSTHAEPADTRAYVGRALQVHNERGFGAKESSVARAMLYSLAPPGSVIVVPDPLWVSATWAGMLAGAAARGCQVIIIAPALANAPSPETPIIALEREVLLRLVAVRDRLGDRIAAAGGALRIGLFAAKAPATDIPGRFAEVRSGLARAPWIRQTIPFDSPTLALLDSALAKAQRTERPAATIAQDVAPRAPQLHQKTVLVARAGAIASLVSQPGWANVLARSILGQAQQTERLSDLIGVPAPAVDTIATRAEDALFLGYEHALAVSDRARVGFYFSLGSQNHDPRGIMLDGESSVIVSGIHASEGLVDLFYLMARTTWVDSNADVDRLVPAPRGLMARLAHMLRFAM
jgi:phosphatidylserine/phosphatidylglycerophosphate/cardiolipin synthase-like enzyme